MKRKNMEDRFWKMVVRGGANDCWLWSGFCNTDGYGAISLPGKNGGMMKAHRYSFNLANPLNAIQKGSLDVIMHTCDVPACVNPLHLKRGSRRENNIDSIRKGRNRHPCGENNSKAKLTLDQVGEIKHLYRPRVYGLTSVIAKIYGVSRVSILDVVSGKTWKKNKKNTR